MAIDERLTEHARGAMIGLAIGDALGMPTQSMSAERIIECYGGPVRRLMDAVPQQPIAPNMKAGSVTDDTEQAFVLAARLIEDHGRIDNDAYAQDLLRWEAKMKEKGSLDLLGPSTKAALQALVEGVDPELTGRFGTTNGGAMRATPVGIAFIPGNALAEEAWRSCVVTHNTMQGIESTTLVAAAVSLAIAGGAWLPFESVGVRGSPAAARQLVGQGVRRRPREDVHGMGRQRRRLHVRRRIRHHPPTRLRHQRGGQRIRGRGVRHRHAFLR